MKKIILFSLFFLFTFFINVETSSAAEAACLCTSGRMMTVPDCSQCNSACEFSGVMDDTQRSCSEGAEVKDPPATQAAAPQELPNPLGKGVTVELMIARIINFVLSLVGSISLLMFIYGGLTWMTSAGSQEKVKKGREIIVWAIIGLAVVFFSYLLVRFVISGLTG